MIKQLSECQAQTIVNLINKAAEKFKSVASSYRSPFCAAPEILDEFKRLTFYGFFIEDKLVGLMGLQSVENNLALVRDAYVLPANQKQGVGSSLLKFIEKEAARQGKTKLLVGTYSKADWAIDFYTKYGFKKAADPQQLLTKYWSQIPCCQREESIVLEKKLKGGL